MDDQFVEVTRKQQQAIMTDLTQNQPNLVPRIEKDLQLSSEEAGSLMAELIKFLNLHKLQPGNYTPSKVVDEAWHIFLLFTRTYEAFCTNVIGHYVHHEPGDGSAESEEKYNAQYQHTISAMKRFYGSVDKRYWPHGIHVDAKCGSCESVDEDKELQ